jgi:serine/threonine protein kinase
MLQVVFVESHMMIVMELLDQSLGKFVTSKGHLEEAEARSVMKSVITGVRFCHRHGICCRDLKPQNIMCKVVDDRVESIKLVDFGTFKVSLACRVLLCVCVALSQQ